MLGFPYAAHATDYTWNGNAGDSSWNTAANWSPLGVPGAQDTAYVGGTAAVQVPSNVTLQNLRLGSDAAIVNLGALKVTGWTSSDGVVEGGQLTIPAGAAATINLSATKLARNPLHPMLYGPYCKGKDDDKAPKKGKGADGVKFGKVKNKGRLKINVDSSVDVSFDDVENDGGDATLSATGSVNDAPIQLKGLANRSGRITLVGSGIGGRAFQGEDISNSDEMVFDGASTLAKKDYSNDAGAKMSLTHSSLLGSSDKSKKLDNKGTLEAMDGDAEIQMELKNNGGRLHVGAGRLRIAPPDGKTVTQTGGTTTIDDGILEIVDSVKNPADGGLQLKGGVLDGSGTITGNVTNDGGSLNVGHSPGLMIINGNYTQTANGLMNMEVWGTVPGYLYDQLRVEGNAYLNGGLTIDYGNGFVPGRNSFWHVRYGFYIGKFSSVQVKNTVQGRYYRLTYTSSGVYSSTDYLLDRTADPSFYGIDFHTEQPRQYVRGL